MRGVVLGLVLFATAARRGRLRRLEFTTKVFDDDLRPSGAQGRWRKLSGTINELKRGRSGDD